MKTDREPLDPFTRALGALSPQDTIDFLAKAAMVLNAATGHSTRIDYPNGGVIIVQMDPKKAAKVRAYNTKLDGGTYEDADHIALGIAMLRARELGWDPDMDGEE